MVFALRLAASAGAATGSSTVETTVRVKSLVPTATLNSSAVSRQRLKDLEERTRYTPSEVE